MHGAEVVDHVSWLEVGALYFGALRAQPQRDICVESWLATLSKEPGLMVIRLVIDLR